MHDLTTNEAINWEKYEYLWRTLPSGDVGELDLVTSLFLMDLRRSAVLNPSLVLCIFSSDPDPLLCIPFTSLVTFP
jgi:hypothetical protein